VSGSGDASAQHQPVGCIAKLMHVSESHVRRIIHDTMPVVFGPRTQNRRGSSTKADQITHDRLGYIVNAAP
jgi:hypothetical protein